MNAAERFRAGMEGRDLAAVLATFAPDVKLHSPITGTYTFDGIEDVGELLAVVYEELGLEDIEVIAQLGDAPDVALFVDARIGGVAVKEAMLLRLDEDDRIAELTLYVRPLPALARLLARLGPPLARRRGRGKSALVRPSGMLLRSVTGIGERITPWLLRRPGQAAR